MLVKINAKNLSGEVNAPPSKSYAHRLIISAFLSGDKVTIKNCGNSSDVLATISALRALGGDISVSGNEVIVHGRREVSGKVLVDAGESGSTLRFLMPIAVALGISAEFTGHGRLLNRPIGELSQTLISGGGIVNGHSVSGKLKAGKYVINAGVSSQYITGLLMALPLLDGDSTLILQGKTVSVGYIDITLSVLKTFKIEVEKIENGFYIKGNQKYKAPSEIVVEGDYSGSAFMLSLGAICGSVTVKGLNENSMQGDAEIVNVLKKFGAKVSVEKGAVTVKKGELKAITLDCEDIPDLVQVIASVGAYASGTTVLKNVDRLRLKESDRITAVIQTLKSGGITSWYENGNLYVTGGVVKGGSYLGGNDHRTVMSAVVLSSMASGSSEIIGAEAHKKSYTDFFEHFKSVGGDVDVEV